MNGNYKTFSIGLFVLAAIALLMWTILWVKPSVGDEKQILVVRFTGIDKIIVGTRVLFAGQPVGEVTKIEEIRDARVDTINGKVYIFQLTLNIDSNIDVYTTDLISIKTSGLLGEKAIDITPLPPQPGKPFERANRDDILYAVSSGSVEEAFGQINKLSGKMEKVFDQVGDIFRGLDNAHFWDNLSTGAKNFEEVTTSLNNPTQWKETLGNLHAFSADVKESWKKIDKGMEDIAKAAEGFMDISVLAKDIMKTVEQGKGSVGAFLMKDDFFLQTKAIMGKVEILMNDINHYGLLFHSDRRWQRQRERKAAKISTLCSPQSFRNYFQSEVDEIATGLARVTAVINESEEKCCQFDCCFEGVFADLLRRIQTLGELIVHLNEEIRAEECCSPGRLINCTTIGPIKESSLGGSKPESKK